MGYSTAISQFGCGNVAGDYFFCRGFFGLVNQKGVDYEKFNSVDIGFRNLFVSVR